jgi:hypothetical protein
MTTVQAFALCAAVLVAGMLIAYRYRVHRRGTRTLHATLPAVQPWQPKPTPCEAAMRDALYLVRSYQQGQPTSRREVHKATGMSERRWANARAALRSAGLLDANDRWHAEDYRHALEALQAVCRERVDLERQGKYVAPWG